MAQKVFTSRFAPGTVVARLRPIRKHGRVRFLLLGGEWSRCVRTARWSWGSCYPLRQDQTPLLGGLNGDHSAAAAAAGPRPFFPFLALPLVSCGLLALYYRLVKGAVAWKGRAVPLR